MPDWEFYVAPGREVQTAVLAWRREEYLTARGGEFRRREVCIFAERRVTSTSKESWSLSRLARSPGGEWSLSLFSVHLPFPMLHRSSKETLNKAT